ncbi:MAG: SAM-dependent methyltransferase [gamma proteobacterium symbiont of Bathyaustriella thionipta]|nr:SAM-dependent methyltransferase [gamma proteobacterium symbiont of Bathyaustriella thionipta]MCU7950204.1 SAM-dependent methyltransferase [gamma proteobacterium symbiont of Bathyaustriella thionipta]MCU7953799.1 SAM-dependent methyltransferase [gamma proteobacterium symbiont of Bathyaustriella thionipta]MCU7956746.1 SAM-dependent methyltransferase [gamma proteobacterium symbiont of Bathyaustriella thionipta]MCU7968932.1 SAM-dependent methyltransferase [gamma proteobacterium symbiont of Bathy
MPKQTTSKPADGSLQKKADGSFPEPSTEVKAHSDQLKQLIQQTIKAQGGQITFADYMNQALYTPGLGYYSAGLKKFGKQGDFITAPEISPLFSQCLALQCIHIMQQTEQHILLEVGAGSGIMAIELVLELERQVQLPEQYLILELSAELRDRQQQAIKARLPHLYERFVWLDCLPEKPFSGIVLANELLDAMPVHLLRLEPEQILERYVAMDSKDNFIWQDDIPENPRLQKIADNIRAVQKPLAHLNDKPDQPYITEVNLQAIDWIKSIAEILTAGAILLVDYGYTATEYYHPQRSMGTLMCHYQHHRHDDPFYLPGLQDITAHIDFSGIAHAANDSGLNVSGFTTQAHFLMAGGLVELTKDLDPDDIVHFTEIARQIKMLTLPEEMGELFKVILLAKDKTLSLPAFKFQNFQDRL